MSHNEGTFSDEDPFLPSEWSRYSMSEKLPTQEKPLENQNLTHTILETTSNKENIDKDKLLEEILKRIDQQGESEFAIYELFSKEEWAGYPVQGRRGAGRAIFKKVDKRLLTKDGWIIEPVLDTNPQRYKKYQQEIIQTAEKKIFLNEIANLEQPFLRDLLKILDASGKWLQIVDKPSQKN